MITNKMPQFGIFILNFISLFITVLIEKSFINKNISIDCFSAGKGVMVIIFCDMVFRKIIKVIAFDS